MHHQATKTDHFAAPRHPCCFLRYWLIGWLCAGQLLLNGCAKYDAVEAELFVFGTLVQIKLEGLPADQAEAAVNQISERYQQLHNNWHAWQPGTLEQLNQAIADQRPGYVDDELRELLQQAAALEGSSQGTFNPAIGNLIRLWGFHTSDYPVVGPPPTTDAIAALIEQRPSMGDLEFLDNRITSRNPAVRVDLGAIGKGAAVDIGINIARLAGASAALINAGGDLRAFGTDNRPAWRIAIRHPVSGAVLGGIESSADEAIFTSGNYTRYRQDRQQRYPHILDPRSGQPVRQIASATVIASSGLTADATATALVVAGPKQWRAIARQMGVTQALVVDENGCVAMTAAMAQRVQLREPPCQTSS